MFLGVFVQARPYLPADWLHLVLVLATPLVAWRVARASRRRRDRRDVS